MPECRTNHEVVKIAGMSVLHFLRVVNIAGMTSLSLVVSIAGMSVLFFPEWSTSPE
jgi:hypothetical protein